jgi:phosphohistidine phosphatase
VSSARQAAAIPFRRQAGAIEICLIRRFDRERWGIPKGIIDPGQTSEETALTEAREEAGLRGRLIGEAIGAYDYRKWGRKFTVAVFLMEVREEQSTWLESAIRERQWTTIARATSLLSDHPVHPLLNLAWTALRDLLGRPS